MAGVTTHRAEHNREGTAGRSPTAGSPGAGTGLAGYDAARGGAAVYDRSPRGLVATSGRDAVSFLHGILTNDIQGLEAGRACYAAYLTPQGRMLADMDVLRLEDGLLLDVEPSVREDLVRRLDQSLFTEDVRITDRSGDLRSIGVYGPAAAAALRAALAEASGGGFEPPATDRHATAEVNGEAVIVLGTGRFGPGGFHVFGPPRLIERLAGSLVEGGAASLGALAAESLRIEAGIPRFGTDMTDDTIPLEAGIEGRAISMTKGCYVGQEVIVRILHRGHGRVAKRLVGLRMESRQALPAPGTRLESGGRDVGFVTSAVVSPRFGSIALGYVHRDATQPGTPLVLAGADATGAVVARLPFGDDEPA